MSIGAAILPEFDHEMATTRKTLERVPDALFDWKPHARSYTMGALAGHLSNIPAWTKSTLEHDSLDFAPNGVPLKQDAPKNTVEILKNFDANVAAARAAIATANDAVFAETWTLLANGQKIFAQPKAGVLRGFIISHLIHHRAQLGVYLRLNDIPHPSMYGPSADEGM